MCRGGPPLSSGPLGVIQRIVADQMSLTSPVSLRLRALWPWDTIACHQLGAMYATGEGVGKDETAALRWYGRGARRGDPESQYDLGFMLLLGEGAVADPKVGIRWLSFAARAGHFGAAQLLAELHATGERGVPRSEAESAYWASVAERLRHDG